MEYFFYFLPKINSSHFIQNLLLLNKELRLMIPIPISFIAMFFFLENLIVQKSKRAV